MATTSNPGPALPPTIFVLFGATGGLAKRLALPAFYRLNLKGLLPRQWLLVGNGHGDVAHEDFRKHVHDVLTEFGPKPEPAEWKAFAGRLLFAGGRLHQRQPRQPAGRPGPRAGVAGRPAAAGALPGDTAGGVRGDDQGARPARAG
jgi:Glucose-6-phosphate dehydrogenase, NAD binding domain